MQTRPRHPRARRLLAALLAMLVGTVVAVTAVTVAPAYAATSITYCFPYYQDGELVGYFCFEVPYAHDPNPCLCPDLAIELITDVVLPERFESGYLDQVSQGLGLVGAASAARNPRDAQRLEQQALDAFIAAGAYLDGAQPRAARVGVADVANLRFNPSPQPWLEAAGTDIADGLGWINAARRSPEPAPSLNRAMEEFRAAYGQLAARR